MTAGRGSTRVSGAFGNAARVSSVSIDMSKNTMKSAVLLAAIGGLFVLIGGVIGRGPGLFIGLVLAFGFVGFSYWKSDTLAIKAARAEPVAEAGMPQYSTVVRELT